MSCFFSFHMQGTKNLYRESNVNWLRKKNLKNMNKPHNDYMKYWKDKQSGAAPALRTELWLVYVGQVHFIFISGKNKAFVVQTKATLLLTLTLKKMTSAFSKGRRPSCTGKSDTLITIAKLCVVLNLPSKGKNVQGQERPP